MGVAPLVHRESRVVVVIIMFGVFNAEIWLVMVSHNMYNTIQRQVELTSTHWKYHLI